MAKIAKHFTVTKHLPKKAAIEFSGIIYNNDTERYDIEDVRFHTPDGKGGTITEDITQFFHHYRQFTNDLFHDSDIQELLAEWLKSDEGMATRLPYEVVAVVGTYDQLTDKNAA